MQRKMAFMGEGNSILALSYTPWLNRLVPDINMSYLSYNRAINKRSAFGMSFKYFSLGNIDFRDEQGKSIREHSIPMKWAIDGSYSLKLSETWSGGIALSYIYSNLTQGQSVQVLQTKPGHVVCIRHRVSITRADRKNIKDVERNHNGLSVRLLPTWVRRYLTLRPGMRTLFRPT